MGANQSSKSQLGPSRLDDSIRRTSEVGGGDLEQQQPPPQVRHKLSASLRKSVNNVLAGKLAKSSSTAKGGRKATLDSTRQVADGSGLHDAYYVTHGSGTSAPSCMNNYVTMQQQPQPARKPPRSMTAAVAAAGQTQAASPGPPVAASQQLDQGNNAQNGVYGLIGGGGGGRGAGSMAYSGLLSPSGGGGKFYTIDAPPADPLVAAKAADSRQTTMARDGSFNCGHNMAPAAAAPAAVQDNEQSNNLGAAVNIGAPSRSQQQQMNNNNNKRHPTSSAPFQLSRAVNTKTSNVLATANGAVAMPKSHERQQQHHNLQQSNGIISAHRPQLAPTAANQYADLGKAISSISSPTANQQQQQQFKITQQANNKSPSQYQAQQYQQQISGSQSASKQPFYSSAAAAANNVGQHHPNHQQQQVYIDEPDGGEQFYARNLLDMDKLSGQQFQQQVRYKCPQQQYQYHNTSAIDFHQATYNHLNHNNNNNNCIQNPIYQQQQQQQALRPHQLVDNLEQLHLDCSRTPASASYNRSYSFGSSHALEAGKYTTPKKNPLALLFQNSGRSNSESRGSSGARRHSNTISLAKHRNNKSIGNISAGGANSSTNNQRSFSSSLKRIKSAPLTAQQATYEAMRTIDMYLIRQIARSCMVRA